MSGPAKLRLPLLYGLFAAASTGVNLALQRLVLPVCVSEICLPAAMLVGTSAGVILKYVLDKRYIFGFRTRSVSDNLGRFLLYSLMSVVTTLVFWATELTFHAVWKVPESKYVGALVGLSAGYTLKYFLDRRFVFTSDNMLFNRD